VRDLAGALIVKSGFRSPPYNAQQPGAATSSRHMFGDGFDLVPTSSTQAQLADHCEARGADYVATYTSGHVHCDWRNDPNDPLFFGQLAQEPWEPGFSAATLTGEIVDDDGLLWVDASGYDDTEGELTRSWVARDADGRVISFSSAMVFVPPPGTASVDVEVGRLRTFSYALPEHAFGSFSL
jgi:hypothetical protein